MCLLYQDRGKLLTLAQLFNANPQSVDRPELRLAGVDGGPIRDVSHYANFRNHLLYLDPSAAMLRQVSSDSIPSTDSDQQVDNSDYLEFRLALQLLRWLDSTLIWSPAKRVIKYLSVTLAKKMNNTNEFAIHQQGNDADYLHDSIVFAPRNDSGRESRENLTMKVDGSVVRMRLIQNLQISKWFNLFMVLSHSSLVMKTIDLEWLRDHLAKARALTFQNFHSTLIRPALNESHQSINWHQDGQEGNICYYLLLVTVLDFFNNLYWYHSKETIVPYKNHRGRHSFGLRRITWLRSTLHILMSPRHIFQAAYVGLFIALGPLGGSLGLMIGLYNSLNQMLRHGYNYYRTNRYLEIVIESGSQELEHGQQEEAEVSMDENNNVTYGGRAEVASSTCEQNIVVPRAAWSNWPVNLSSCFCEFSDSYRYQFERLLMMSQMLGAKVAIFTLLLHIDSHKFDGSPSSLLAIACLVESFLAMHSFYDKYYARYINRDDLLKKNSP